MYEPAPPPPEDGEGPEPVPAALVDLHAPDALYDSPVAVRLLPELLVLEGVGREPVDQAEVAELAVDAREKSDAADVELAEERWLPLQFE